MVCILMLDMLGATLPKGIVYWLNPVAWFSNWTGLTPRIGGFLRGMDEGVMALASVVGMPIIGSLIFWFVLGCLRWRWPSVVFILCIVPALCAVQLTTKRAYLEFAERFHAQNLPGREADAISKALFIIRESRIPDPAEAQLVDRLVILERQQRSGER